MSERIIKFRGKRKDNREWLYGNLIVTTHIGMWIGEEKDRFYQVVPDSVSQFTGLKDKNGVDIYEGHIVKNIYINSEAFGEESVVEWHGNISGFTLLFESIGQHKMLGMYEKIEIIGNIFDNPELLKQ